MDFLEKYKVVRRLVMIWACALISYGTAIHFKSGQAGSASYIALVGILSTVVGFYFKKRYDEDEDANK